MTRLTWKGVLKRLEASSLGTDDYQAAERAIFRAKNSELQDFRQGLLRVTLEFIEEKEAIHAA